MAQRGRPQKLAAEVPECLKSASPEAQALGMEPHAINVIIPEYTFLCLDTLAYLRTDINGPKVTVSDIVRTALDEMFACLDEEARDRVNQAAVRRLEFEASELAIRASHAASQPPAINL